jgi:hypothetical protein
MKNSLRCILKKPIFVSLFCFTTAFFTGCSTPQVATILPTDANIQYHGRWNFSDPSVPWVYWQGSSIFVNFDGTGISLDIEVESGTEQYRIVIDGTAQPERLYVTGRKTKVLAKGLAPGIHTLEVMKETWEGEKTYFHGLKITGAGLVAPPKRPALRIEFFGDSDMDGSSNYSEKNTGDMGTYYAFPAMITRMLGAEMNLQAVGGATIDDGGDDGNNDVYSFIFAQKYGKEVPDYRSGFAPHIIVIHAGANDMGAGKKAIKKRYKNAIAALHKVYGSKSHIVLSSAYGYDINEPSAYIDEVVKEVGGNLSACLFSWSWERWHGCQWEQSGMAHGLVDHITSLNPEWVEVKPNDIIDGFGRNFDVANGSFEHKAPFGGFGWRYMEDGVERIKDSAAAADGDYFIRLPEGTMVHQPFDATGDNLPGATTGTQAYKVTAMIRGTTSDAIAQINADFEEQVLYNRTNSLERSFTVSTAWKEYSTSFAAPVGSWKTFVILKSKSGTVEFDNIRMSDQQVICGDGVCVTNLECDCTADCGQPPSTEIRCTDGFDNDCDGDIDCADVDCIGEPACRPMLPQSNWRVHSFSSHEVANNAMADYAIDGHPGTIWHTQWSPSSPAHPHEIIIDLGGLCDIEGFKYLRRPEDSGDNGTIADYEFYVSTDGANWAKAIAKGTFENTYTEKEVIFDESIRGRYVRLVALSEINGGPWASVAEVSVFGNLITKD